MYSWSIKGINIKVNLDCGLYSFGYDSAVGKSYLRKLMVKSEVKGLPVLGYGYEEDVRFGNLEQLVSRKPYKVILIDRYDRFAPKYWEMLRGLQKQSIILIDCKSYPIPILPFCEITRTLSSIEVMP